MINYTILYYSVKYDRMVNVNTTNISLLTGTMLLLTINQRPKTNKQTNDDTI